MSMDARDIPESIQWHEGLLLTPQHFQQLSLRHEALLQYVASSIAPFNWGVRHVKIAPDSLAAGSLRVVELEAVMPDSLVVSFGARRGEELQVDLTQYEEQLKQRPVTVHLAVATRESDRAARGDLARYDSVEGDPVTDENTGEGNLRIPRLRPRLRLLVADEPPKKYVALPVARVYCRDEAYTLTDFIPPALAVERRSPLGILCSLAARRLREKAMYLADQLRVPAAGARAGADRDTESLIRSLVASLPLLEAVLGAGASHPYIVYLALCSVAGQVSVMGRSPVPPAFAPYDHNDLRATFEPVLAYISRKLDEGVTATFTAHPFSYEEGVYSLQFQPSWADKRLALGLRSATGTTEQEMVRWGYGCVIGSRNRMLSMRESRVLGARRRLIERDEDLVPPRGVVLFALQADREFVEPDEELQIFNAGEYGQSQRPQEIVLYVRNDQ